MKKKQYLVYVLTLTKVQEMLSMQNAVVLLVAFASILQLLYSNLLTIIIERGLSDVPDDKSCTQELQTWHIPRKNAAQEAVLFEDLIFPQDTYDK